MRSAQLLWMVSLIVCCTSSVGQGEDALSPHWNQFRGPHGNGISRARDLPVEFSETKNVRWKVPVPGVGWSSPVIWGNQVWVTSGMQGGQQLLAICVDLKTGKTLHRVNVFDVVKPGME